MDRLTSKDYDGNNIITISTDWAYYPRRNIIEIEGDVADKLAAYEDTGLTPEEITAMKAEYSDTFQSHLNQMCDIKDKRITELEAENARLKRLIGDIERILGKEEQNAIK